MTQSNAAANRIVAAVSALALSFLLFSGTVAGPVNTNAPTAYVGVVA
ncbi:MAG: hypothetical protein JSR96_01340 [Proteobacteria bacterium]|nr:hypothetical protein [Pseudomonadota bacterium]